MPLDPGSPSSSNRTVVRAACPHDCPDTCALLITVEAGRAVEVEGAPDHPTTRGTLCTKVARYLERTYAKDRVLHPLRRVGPKGSGRFERMSWDEALDTIVERFQAIAASSDGPQAILPYSYAGTMGLVQSSSMDRRFFHRLGDNRCEIFPQRFAGDLIELARDVDHQAAQLIVRRERDDRVPGADLRLAVVY